VSIFDVSPSPRRSKRNVDMTWSALLSAVDQITTMVHEADTLEAFVWRNEAMSIRVHRRGGAALLPELQPAVLQLLLSPPFAYPLLPSHYLYIYYRSLELFNPQKHKIHVVANRLALTGLPRRTSAL
jgi:hypothetical protein